jgi:hypothetical protein
MNCNASQLKCPLEHVNSELEVEAGTCTVTVTTLSYNYKEGKVMSGNVLPMYDC